MRDKLKELILEYRNYPQKTCPRYDETTCNGCKYDLDGECDEVGRLTDHLIANNVFVLPEQMKDSWELALPFMMRLLVADEAEIEKIKGEFEFSQKKKILTDIRDYLVERKSKFKGASYHLDKVIFYHYAELLGDLAEYAKKLGVEL